jgi:calcineurin-like phosphoesterase
MTGDPAGVIGFDGDQFLDLFLGKRTSGLSVAKGPADLNAVLIEVDVENRRALSIERVYRARE